MFLKKKGLEQQYDALLDEIDVLQDTIDDISENIENLQNKLAKLEPDTPDWNDIQQQIAEAQAHLDESNGLLAQKESERNNLDVLLNQLQAQISEKEAAIARKEEELDRLAVRLATLKAERDRAQEQLDEVNAQLEEVEEDIDDALRTIADLEKAIDDAQNAIPRLQEEIAVLEMEIQALDEDIETLEDRINVLDIRIAQFDIYLANPDNNSRMGIYAATLSNGRRYATPELVEVFDLTREKYQDDYLFISLHCNSTAANEQTTSSGISVFYRDNGPYSYSGTYGANVEYYLRYNASKRDRFARALLEQLNATTNFSRKYTAPYKADFSVLRENNLISVLVEVGFINNPNDRALLVLEQTREDVAAGIYKGIVEYYK